MSKLNDPFTSADISGMSQEDFAQAIQGLVTKDVMEEVIIDGTIKYRLTDFGRSIGPHMNSNIEERN